MRKSVVTALCITFLSSMLIPAVASAAGPIPILLLDGQSGGPYHVWQLTSSVLKKELDTIRAEVDRVLGASRP